MSVVERPVWNGWTGVFLARGQGAALRAGLHSSICGSLRLAAPLRPAGSKVRSYGAGSYSPT